MPVPASYNDVLVDAAVRDHVGDAWYQTTVRVPRGWAGQRVSLAVRLRDARRGVWVGDTEVARHEGGYTPFEADVTELVPPGDEVRVTVVVNNELTFQTIPPGIVTTPRRGAGSSTSTTSSTSPGCTGRCGCTRRRRPTSTTSWWSRTCRARPASSPTRSTVAGDTAHTVRVTLRDADGARWPPPTAPTAS